MIIPQERLNLEEDSHEVLVEKSRYSRRSIGYQYGNLFNNLDDEDWDELDRMRDYYSGLGFGCTDEEWEEYQRAVNSYHYGEYESDDEPDVIWPPSPKKGKSHVGKSQKFINGIEVDDEEFAYYNESVNAKKGTRRGGKKHSKGKKKGTRYVGDDWDDEHYDSTRYNDSVDSELDKTRVVLYRNIATPEDCITFKTLQDFSDFVSDKGIDIKDNDINFILNNDEIHCCLDPTSTDDVLIIERSYGELVWQVTGGDESLIHQYSQVIDCPF